MKIRNFLSYFALFNAGVFAGYFLHNQLLPPSNLNAYEIVIPGQRNAVDIQLPVFGQVLYKDGFIVLYDGEKKSPRCVVQVLTHKTLQGSVDRNQHDFAEDEEIPKHLRATLNDYRGSGYDRGHMAPATDCRKNVQRMAESFLLSNVCPQDPLNNRGYWAKFEKHVRDLTKQYSKVTVVTGPLFLPRGEPGERYVHYKVIGTNDVAVPTHFFKVLKLESGEVEERAYIIPNGHIAPETPLETFQVTVQEVERVSGVLFNLG